MMHYCVKTTDPFHCCLYLVKFFEKLIYGRMYKFLDVNNLIYNRQFGFRTNYSTEHALISLTENNKKLLDSGNVVCGVFIDLEKMFDTVKHNILCEKLPYYGFRGKIEVLIKSYLSNRKQLVAINGFESVNLDITCGVPQGFNLFLLYINDFRFSLGKATSTHFADDTCILHFSNKLKTVETVLNKDLKHASTWLNANRLSLNVSKSKLLIFQSKYKNIDYSKTSIKLNGIRLLASDHVKYLGIFIDNNLSWDYNTIQLSIKLSQTNGILSKLRHFTPLSSLISVYYSLFYSHVTYGCLVWSLTKKLNINKINILQKKCIHIINLKIYNDHTSPLFVDNKLLKLNDIIEKVMLN